MTKLYCNINDSYEWLLFNVKVDIKFTYSYLIHVTAPPVILDGDLKVAARLGHVASFSQKIYSVYPVTVTLERQTSASPNTRKALTYTTAVSQTRVTIRVFDSDVNTDGFVAVVTLNISSEEEFGEYRLIVSNNITSAASRIIEIVSAGTVSYNTFTIIAFMLDLFSRLGD